MILILFIYTKEIKYIKNTKEKKEKIKNWAAVREKRGSSYYLCVYVVMV